MTRLLHVLPHAGGGAETYLEQLAGLEGYEQERYEIATARSLVAAAPSILTGYWALSRAVHHADLVHIHGDAAAIITLPLIGRKPSVWTTHGLHLLRRRPDLGWAIRLAMRRTSATICTSAAEARELEEIAPTLRDRLLVVPNGIDLPAPIDSIERHAVRKELGLDEEEVVALYLGELEERKRPLDAIEACKCARAKGARVTLLVAGHGPLARAMSRIADSSVRLLGFRDDPHRLLQAADLLILPSAREGHSFALLEAMGRGVTPILADGPGAREAVGTAGMIVPVGNRSALCCVVRSLAEDRDRRAALGAAARELVETRFTRRHLRDGVLTAYRCALA